MSNFNKFLKRNLSKVTSTNNASLHATITTLFEHVKVKLYKYFIHHELSSKVKVFDSMFESERIANFPNLYLEIEDFLSRQPDLTFDKIRYREKLIEKYPTLKTSDEIRVIFVSDNYLQKVILSELFLRDVLLKSKDLLGSFTNNFLLEAEDLLVNS